MPGSFLDTNVLVYLAAGDPTKADRAEALLAEGATISVQVLNETANVLRRKAGLSWTETRAFLDTVRSLAQVEPLTIETHEDCAHLVVGNLNALFRGEKLLTPIPG